MPVILALETIMVEPAVAEVGMMFPLEASMIVRIVGVVAIVAMPCRVRVISITRIVSFKVDAYMNLGAGRLNGKRTGYDHREDKKFRFTHPHNRFFRVFVNLRFHKITFKS